MESLNTKKPFNLQHVVLYSKGWYKRFDYQGRGKNKSVFDDLKILLTLDGYSGEFFKNGDVAMKLLNSLNKFFPDKRASELSYFAENVSIDNAWKFGYYYSECSWLVFKKEYLKPYNYFEAIVYYCLSHFSRLTIEELGGSLEKPLYKKEGDVYGVFNKVLPRPNGVNNKKIKEMFNN